jgi:LysR family nitrogen assimilation transcriptional regulator
MDVRALRCFVHAARFGSLSRAANHLSVAQPAVSRQLQKLEDELGQLLLVRSSLGVELTAAGASLLERADVILRLLEDARTDLMAHDGNPGGRVSFAVTPVAGLLLVPPLIERLSRSNPRLKLNVLERLTQDIQEMLLKDQVDIGLLNDPVEHALIATEPLYVEQLFAVGPGVEQAGRVKPLPDKSLPLSDLEHLPMILPDRQTSLRMLIEKVVVEADVQLKILAEVNGVAITKRLVERGLGYTIASLGTVDEEVARGVLTITPLQSRQLARRLTIARRSDRYLMPGAEVVIAQLYQIRDKLAFSPAQ